MSKKGEIEKTDPKAEVKAEEKLVSVQMTDAEKEAFVSFMAKREADAKPEQQVEINLRTSHRRNGRLFGPGTVVVAESIAGSLISADAKWLNGRLKVHESGNHLIEIIGRGVSRTRKLPVESGL
jgi:hypothetical protein